MNDTTGLELGIHQTHEEHARLHQLLDDCRAQLALPTGPTATTAEKLQTHLTDLYEHLARHFAHEEHGGWLDEAVIRLPRLATQLTALEKQHATLLERLAELIRKVQTIANEAVAWQTVAADFEGFARQLLAHEACEERILQQGFNEDLGLD
jgi:hemerythrin